MPEWWNGRHSGLKIRRPAMVVRVRPPSRVPVLEVHFNARSALNLLRSRIELWFLACDIPDESLAKVVKSMSAVQARSNLEDSKTLRPNPSRKRYWLGLS